jgi:hypothetical protein
MISHFSSCSSDIGLHPFNVVSMKDISQKTVRTEAYRSFEGSPSSTEDVPGACISSPLHNAATTIESLRLKKPYPGLSKQAQSFFTLVTIVPAGSVYG